VAPAVRGSSKAQATFKDFRYAIRLLMLRHAPSAEGLSAEQTAAMCAVANTPNRQLLMAFARKGLRQPSQPDVLRPPQLDLSEWLLNELVQPGCAQPRDHY